MKIASSEVSYAMKLAQEWYVDALNTPISYLDFWWVKNATQVSLAIEKLGWLIDKEYPVNSHLQLDPTKGILVGEAGGPLMNKEELQAIKNLMEFCGEKSFFIIEGAVSKYTSDKTPPPIALEFPLSVKYEQIVSGGALSDRLFDWCVGDYFIFGCSGQWGKFVGNDAESPIQIMIYDQKLRSLICPWYKSFIRPLSYNEKNKIFSMWLEQITRTEADLALICN